MKENFFVIDSEELEQVPSWLYGMAFDGKSIVTDIATFDDKTYLKYSGSFIAIRKSDNNIRIYQDGNGTYGIFLYKEDGYFALSNSFMLLFEYLHFTKGKNLDIDHGYACHFLTIPMCSIAYTSTLCKQIKILPPNVEVEIRVAEKIITTKFIPDAEKIDIYSEEALALVDAWISKWASFMQNLQSQNVPFTIDVSGGFDSRLSLSLALAADIDRSKVNFYSAVGYSVKDDLPIAEALAEKLKFSLNACVYKGGWSSLPAADSWNLSMLTQLGTHHTPYFRDATYSPSRFRFSGQGGETIRNHWYVTPSYFEECMVACDISEKNLSLSGIEFLWGELARLDRVYKGNSGDKYKALVHRLYEVGRARYHFGRYFVSAQIVNLMLFAPLYDMSLRRINCVSHGNVDHDLLMALILTRIDEKLVDVKFNDGKSIAKDCIRRAIEINKKKRLTIQSNSFSIPQDVIKYIPDSSYAQKQESPEERLKRLLVHTNVSNIVARCFGKEFNESIANKLAKSGQFSVQEAFKILAVAKIVEPASSVLISS